jgi:hypothetical protein
MTPDDEQVRETFAHFGKAVYLAQVLEHAIVNAMVVLRLPHRDKFTKFDIDAFMDRQFENTLGKLLKNLCSEVTLPADLETLLTRALKARNWLCHDYFRERAVEFMTPVGREGMIDELQNTGELLKEADQSLGAVVQPLADRYGLTEAAFQAEYESLKRKLGLDT